MPLLAGLGPLGPVELGLILVIVILIFGVGRLPEVGGAIGKGIREFRHATKDDDKKDENVAHSAAPGGDAGGSGDALFCGECGSRNSRAAKFCNSCGKPLEIPTA